MLESDIPAWEKPQGQATFEMANLRPATTGLPFVVFVSQRDGAQHDVRVKVSQSPKVRPTDMGTYALRPFRHEAGMRLDSRDEGLLEKWVESNLHVLVGFWDCEIEYTEDLLDVLVR